MTSTPNYMATETDFEAFKKPELSATNPTIGDNTSSDHDRPGDGSTFGAYANIVCLLVGTGTLGLPLATNNGGWLTLLFIILAPLMALYNGTLLIECLYSQQGQRLYGYPQVGRAAFGTVGYWVIKVLSSLMLLGFGCLYMILTGINIDYLAKGNGLHVDLKLWILLGAAIITLPYILVKTLREVVGMAIFGALSTFIVIIISIVLSFIDYSTHHNPVEHSPANWSGIPLALTTVAFAYGGNVVYPHIESTMKHPKSFPKALGFGMLTVLLGYLIISTVGYFVYGNTISDNILLTLPKSIANDISTGLMTVHVILAAPIFLCSFSLDVEDHFHITTRYMSRKKEFAMRCANRIGTAAVLTVVAMFVPYFTDMMSLIGAITNGFLVFVAPILCHLKLFGFKNRRWWEFPWMVIILVVGCVCFVMGTIDAIRALVKDFNNPPL